MMDARAGRVAVPAGVYTPPGADPDTYLHTGTGTTTKEERGIHVRDHLLAQKGIGDAKADSILDELGVDGDRTLASLGSNQREQLDALIAEHAA
jgi:hypothetical protein